MRIRPVRPRFAVARRARFHQLSSLPISRRSPAIYATEGEGARHATWLELFFDLVFVVLIAELGGLLHEDLTITGFAEFAGLFVLIWWMWMGFSYYADQFDTDDIVHRLGMITVMFGVIALASTVDGALHGGSFAFAAAYLVLRVLYVGMYVRAWRSVTEAKEFLTVWVLSASLVTAVWAISLVVPEQRRVGVWVAFFLLAIANVVILHFVFETVPTQISHFPERLGLFTIIVLGETILAVAAGTTHTEWGVRSAVAGLGGFLIAVAVWQLYFGHADDRIIERGLEANDDSLERIRSLSFAYIFSHYFVYMGIVAAGVGIETVIEAVATAHSLGFGGRLVLCGGIASFLLGSGVCHRTIADGIDDRVLEARVSVAAFVGLLAIVGGAIAPLVLVGVIAFALIGLIVFEKLLQLIDKSVVTPTET